MAAFRIRKNKIVAFVAIAASAAALALVSQGAVASSPESRDSAAPAATDKVVAKSGTAKSHQVKASTFSRAPRATAAQKAFLEQNEETEEAPAVNAVNNDRASAMGPGTVGPSTKQLVGTDFRFYKNGRLPPGGSRSAVDEPSSALAGKHIFATGNWYAAYSHDKGVSYTYLNPFTIFGSGFCCDQVVTYAPGRDRHFWLLQYGDHLTLANSRSTNLSTWCNYNLTPAMFGQAAGTSFDFNKIATSTNFVYFTSNVYSGSGFVNNVVARMNIDQMSRCTTASFQYVSRSTEFSPAFVQGAGDTMYWGTDWPTNAAVGALFRILSWNDSSNTVNAVDRSIDAFTFMSNGQGTCGSADGVVLNWCERTDSRMSGSGYLADAGAKGSNDAVLGWAFNARQDASHPFPYIRRVYFRTSDLAYTGASEFYATWGAHLYPALAPDNRGHVGMAFAWGGGTGTTHYYPGSGVMLDDNVSPSQPWAYSFYQSGAGNPCLNADGTRRWGDYLDIHPLYPAGLGFNATGFALMADAGSCGSTASVDVANVSFGRYADQIGYSRWN